MRNFTFSWFKSSKPNFLVLFFLLLGFTASAQFYTKHYIAPAPWQYFSKANEIVIATNSTSTVNIVLAKSDGTVVANLTAVKGTPAVYRFTGLPSAAKPFALNTVLNAAGLIVTGTAPVSINLRNVASDALGGDGSDQDIKGNAALTSFGDAGLGIRFRVGYYRDGSLGNFGGLGDQRPIYSIMATVNNTVVKINNVVTATLNAGQSYLFKAAIGTLVESSNPAVMNTSAAIDTPGGCGDSAYNQLPPEAVLGTEYFLERGTGNNTAEQTTVVATKDNTTVTIESYTTTGTLSSTNTITLAQAGNFYTFVNGVSNTNFTASHIIADKRVAVYSGTAQNCEVDISTIAPVSECGGSNFIETAKFRDYNSGTLDYFGYILLRSATDVVTVNGTNIATISGVGARYQVGSTGWYLINFNSVQIGSPNVLSIASNSKLTVSIVQQSGGFSMAGFFSNFAVQPEDPTVTYISGGGCTNSSATLTTPSGFAPYQWYYNGTAITGANSDTYTATKTGSYSVSSTLACGSLTQSKPVSVTLCTDLGVTNTVDNATPCVNSNVEFTVKVSNLGLNNATGVSLNDLLPSGYTYSSSTVSVGAYNSTTGVWSIGDLDPSAVATLKIIATVNATGSYNTTASLPASTPDSNTANNSASVSTTPKAITVALVLTGSTICVSPGGNGTITSSTSASGVNYQLYNSSNTVVQTAKAGTGSALTWSGLAAGTGYYVIGTNPSTSCSSTSNTVNVATTANPTALVLTGSTICVSPGGDGTITSSTSVSGVNYQLFNASNTAVQASKPGTGAALTWSGLTAANGYYVIATNAANCTATSNTVNVSTKTNPVTPTLSSVTQPTCSTATGSFTITNYDSNNTYAVTPSAGVTRTGNTVTAPAGSYTLTASANGCTSSSSSAAVVNAQPATPAVPTLSSVIQPTCSTATGSFTITNYDSNNTYTVTPSAGVTRTGNTVTAPAGSYTLTASANGCTSSSSSAAVVNAQPATPAVPTLSSVTQPTCSTATGSFTITNYDSNNTYTVTPSAGVTRTGNTVTAPAGSYTLTASANGCTSSSSSAAVVNAQPATPAVPTLSSVTQPTCSTATGSFTITNYDSNNTYAVTPSAGVTRTGNTVTAPAGSYTLTASANGCTSSSSSAAVVNAQPATPAVPTLSSVTQPTCSTATGSFTITNYDSNNTYTVTPSAGVTRTGNTVTAPAGSYTLTASANGCTSGSTTIVVNSILCANTDNSYAQQASGSTIITVGNVTTNDTLNGAAVTSTNTDVTPKTTGPLSVDADGVLTLAANTVSGTYTITYEICETGANPANCKTADATVEVKNNLIANIDTVSSILASNTSQTLAINVFTNDTKNGTALNPSDVNLTTSVADPKGYLTLNADGTVTLGANAPADTYELTYTICEKFATSNCSSNVVRVTVDTPVIDAVTETTASVNGNTGGTTAPLTANDTLNGNPAVIGTAAGNVKLTAVNVPSGLTLNADGTVTVAANTPAGKYDVEYQICEITNPSNCDAVISKVVVDAAVIDAVTETTAAVNGNAGGTTASLTANDTLNGNPAVIGTAAGNVKLTAVNVPSGLTLNADGTVTVAPNTPAGTYDVEYQICEITNPSNCDAVISKVVVDAAVIDAVTETTASVNGNTGGTTASLTANDTLNGNPAVIGTAAGNVKLTAVNVPSGLTLNADGTVTVAPNTPAGTYDVEYSICEITNPSNCDAVISKVVVDAAVIDAVTETTAAVNGNTGGTTASLTANDTLNGNPVVIGTAAGNVKLTAVNVPSGLTLNADGTVTVAPNTPAGTYDVEYSICEITNPSNCDAVISKVVVDAAVIDAVTETTAAVNGNTGGTTASLTANDTLNGNPVVIGTAAGNVKLTAVNVPSGLTLNADGTVTVAPNTPAGTYDVEYSICEITNPSNCDAVISKVVVDAAVIDAVTETTASVNGNTGGTTASLIANDTLNGNPVVIGTAAGNVKLTGISVPSGLTLNADGTVTVAPNTPAGNYSIEYSICEITNPSNCDAVISTVPVLAGTLIANADIIPSVTGSNTPQTLGTNVFTNDTKNGTALNPSDVTLAVSTPDPKGYLTLNPDGTLTIGANPPAGTYELTYTICEKLNPGNCSSNTVTVTVGAPVIDAVTETTASVNGNTGGTTAPLTANDTLNGNTVVIGTAAGNVKLTGISVPSGLTLNADGTVTVAPNTPAGNYSVEYSICEITNPSNCDAVISTVPVSAGTLIANADIIPSVTGSNTPQTLGTNVFTNDTKNGTALNPSDVTLAVSTPDPKGYLTLNPDGTLTLGANPPAGTYELTYTICEKLNPGNCSSNTVTVTVGAPVIDAVTETTAAVNGNTGGTTASLTSNDTLNGNPVVIGTAAGNVKLTAVNVPSGLTLNADGTVTVAPNTPAGNYSVEYSICEITNPSNCDAVISTVPVSAGTLIANADIIPSVTGSNTPQTLGTNVFTNDTKNGTALNPSDVTLAVSTPDPKGYLTLNPDGTLTLGANPPAGTYELTYTICEKLNPGNCSSNTVTVTVGAPVIDAVTETTAAVNGNAGGTTAPLTANDNLNGNPVVIGTAAGNVKLTGISVPSGLTLNADGTVTVAPNTPAGNYSVEYSICEITNPSNCDAVISKVPVSAGTLVANADIIPSVTGSNTPQTLGTNVFTNDTKNGTALSPSDVTLAVSTPDPKGYLTLNPDGTLTLGANPPAGTYELTYTICEKLNPGNCSSNTVTVTVGAPVIDAVAETLTPSINGSIGGNTTTSVISGDTLNGVQAVIGTNNGQVKLTGINIPAGFTLNADGTVTVAANTPAGTYDVEYSICEITNPTNCDTAISKVVVNAPAGGTLQAVPDVVASVVGINQPQTVINIFNNDLNNGLPLVPADVNLTIVTPDPTGYLTLNPDGTVTLAPNTPRGTYELVYQICEKANPSNCSSASVKVTVEEPTMTITANSYCSNNVPYVNYSVVPDNFTAANLLTIKWIDSANNVVATQVNQPLSGTILWPGATVDANGNGTDWPGWVLTNGQWAEGADGFENTRPAVRMEFSLNPTETVSVTYPLPSGQCNAKPTFTIQANNDSAAAVDATKGLSTGINVFNNDTLNGVKVNPADVILSTVLPNSNLILNADGTVDVKAGTPSGPYQLTYQICEAANTSNCSQATVNVVVQNSGTPVNPTLPLVLTDDVLVSVDGINGSLEFVNVLDNDLLNGQPINPIDVIITNLSGDSNFEFNADGTVNVKPNTPGKTYDLVYQVCEKANPTNCSTAVVHVFVEVPAIAIIKTAVFNDENNNNNADPGETITYKFEVTNTGNVPLKGVTISDPLPGVKVSGDAIDLAVGESNNTNFSAVYKITQTDINNEKVTNQASVKGNSARGVVVEDISDDEGVNGDKPTVTSLKGCEIRVLNAFSPNGDQKNERFYIQGIGCYPDNTVEIYNRWGVLVFEKDGYNNEDRVFKGYSEGRTTMKQSEGLPVGTYFYILKYKDSGSNAHEKSGYLYINK